jgi:hypothetical protein
MRPDAGLVIVEAPPWCIDQARAALVATTGQAPIEGEEAAAVYSAVTSGPSSDIAGWSAPSGHPEVLLRANWIIEASGPGSEQAVPEAVDSTVKVVGTVRFAASDKPKVKIKVGIPGLSYPAGKVLLTWGSAGRKVVSVKKSAKGTVEVTLPKLAKGRYGLNVRFTPTDPAVKASKAKKVWIKVKGSPKGQ